MLRPAWPLFSMPIDRVTIANILFRPEVLKPSSGPSSGTWIHRESWAARSRVVAPRGRRPPNRGLFMRNDIAGAQCVATAQANDFDIVLARCSRLSHLGGKRVVRESARVCRWIGPAAAGAMLKQKLR